MNKRYIRGLIYAYPIFLRKQIFSSLYSLNLQISRLLKHLNDRPLKKLEGSRQIHFETINRPALWPLPANSSGHILHTTMRSNKDEELIVKTSTTLSAPVLMSNLTITENVNYEQLLVSPDLSN